MTAERRRLPNRRSALALRFEHRGIGYRAHIGFFGNGEAAELFIDCAKQNSAIDSFAADAAILASLLLQHGASLDEIGHSLKRNPDGTPASVIGQAVDVMLNEVAR
jgi:hypothetical protein